MKKDKFDIQGMTCSSCSSHVEKAVIKLNGVEKVVVNLLSNNMIVEYDDSKLSEDKIIDAVVSAGYGANKINSNKLVELNTKVNTKIKENTIDNTIKSMKKRLIISIIFLIPLMYLAMYNMLHTYFNFAIPQVILDFFDGAKNGLTLGFTQMLLLMPIVYVNRNYFIKGYKMLFKGTPTMESLISIGSSAAILYGIYAIYMISYGLGHNILEIAETFSKNLYFESAGTILTLITFGKFLETKSKRKTSIAIEKIINLAPKTSIIEVDGKETETLTENINVDDIVIIKPGSSIPVDGVLIEGNSYVDQASITGESIPVVKKIGDKVISGTINKNGYFKMKAQKVGEDTTLSQIIKLVEEAGNSKAPISKIADKVSSIFVPCVMIIALITTIIWILNGQTIEFALSMGISVLVISCPCALGLATPVAIMVGTGKGATQGILFKDAEHLETLHLVDTVVFDKTGTITEGKPKVTNIIINEDYLFKNIESKNKEKYLLQIAASLEKNSEHPLSEAVIMKAQEEKISLLKVENFNSIPGKGISGYINGNNYLAGNKILMEENKATSNTYNNNLKQKIEEFLSKGQSIIYIAEGEQTIGAIVLADTIKESSYEAISTLKNKKIEVAMLTGDTKLVAESIGRELGIDTVIADVLPQDKEKEIQKLQSKGKKVVFVGDGINDSPALVRANVGIAIGTGTDIAIESADVILKNDDLLSVCNAIELSKAVINNIKLNLFWAFFYNCIGIPIAAGVFYLSNGLKLNPMLGAAAMSLSSVCVVTNALRLNLFKIKRRNETKSIENCELEKDNNNEDKIINEKDGKEVNFIKTIYIEGMQCNHCKMTVEKVLNAFEGVTKAEVNLEEKKAIVESTKEINNEKIKSKIEEAGFVVNNIQEGV